jgi:translocator assembly and maintenance protein 41
MVYYLFVLDNQCIAQFKVLRYNDEIMDANETNLCNALRASLLMLPERFPEQDLWHTITSLSYLGTLVLTTPQTDTGVIGTYIQGDFRMTFGENPNKIRNIVTPENTERFRALYTKSLARLHNIVQEQGDHTFKVSTNKQTNK